MGNQEICCKLAIQPNAAFHFQKDKKLIHKENANPQKNPLLQIQQQSQIQSKQPAPIGLTIKNKYKNLDKRQHRLNEQENNQIQRQIFYLQSQKYLSLSKEHEKDNELSSKLQESTRKQNINSLLKFQSQNQHMNSVENKIKKIQISQGLHAQRPQLLTPVIQTAKQLSKLSQIVEILHQQKAHYNVYYRQYAYQLYEGQLDQVCMQLLQKKQYPHGFGRIYKSDGTLYVGNFANGKAQGRGVYIFKDGSYYKGLFENNQANDKNGQYKSKFLSYFGQFKDNLFQGKGYETGQQFTFKGQYRKGKRYFGRLKWKVNKDDCQYQGQFNDQQMFQGEGTLVEPSGMYRGQFVKGIKHGKGTYYFPNGIKYEGNYENGQKHGFGKIYRLKEDKQFELIYEGNFKDGIPNEKQKESYQYGRAAQSVLIQGEIIKN